MNELQETKRQIAIAPAAIVNNADFTSNVIDITDFAGADYLEFVGVTGSIDATMATLKVMESDTKTDATTLGGTPVLVQDASVKPTNADGDKTFVIGISLRANRQRYLQLQAKAGNGAAGTFLTVTVVGRRLTQASSNASERGSLFCDYA